MKTYETIFDAVDRTGRTRLESIAPLILDPEKTPHGYRADRSGCPVTVEPKLWEQAKQGNMEALHEANQKQAGCIYDHPETRAWLKQKTWEAIYGSSPTKRMAREQLAFVVVGVKDASRESKRANTREVWKSFGVLLQMIAMIQNVRKSVGEKTALRLFPGVAMLHGKTNTDEDRDAWKGLIMGGRGESIFNAALRITADIGGYAGEGKLRHEAATMGYDAKERKKWIRYGKTASEKIVKEND